MWRERGGEDAAPKDTAFLPLRASMCTHRFAEYKECSRMISLVNTSREKTLEEGLALFLYSLAGDPKGGGAAPISCLKPSALANEKTERPIRFHCGQIAQLP